MFVNLLANTIDRARTANSLASRTERLPRTLRDHVRSASALSALTTSSVANLSAKRQLSVAKMSTKRIFSLATRDFFVVNGRRWPIFRALMITFDFPLVLPLFLVGGKVSASAHVWWDEYSACLAFLLLEPERYLSQTSQNAAMRCGHPPFFLFPFPQVPRTEDAQ